MTVRYRADYKGTGELMNSPEMVAVMREVAEKGKPFAESIAPVYEGVPRRGVTPGEYKASFVVEAQAHGGVKGDRAEAQLVNTSAHAAHVEWQDGYHVLDRTAEALGTL